MPQQDYEITENDFQKEINRCIFGFSEGIREDVTNKCFELAKVYHKQELSKVFVGAEKELPDFEKTIEQLNYFKEGSQFRGLNYDTFNEGAKWMRDKASLVIAKKDEQFWHHDTVLRAIISEKDKIIAEKDGEIRALKEANFNGFMCGQQALGENPPNKSNQNICKHQWEKVDFYGNTMECKKCGEKDYE